MKKIFLLITMLGNFIYASAFRVEYGNNIIINQPVNENLYIAGILNTFCGMVNSDLTCL